MLDVPSLATDMSLRQALREKLTQRKAEKTGERMRFFDWAMRVPEAKVGPLDFDRFPFQRELYSQEVAEAEEVVLMKSTQVGISTWLLRWAMYLTDIMGYTTLYLFPKRQQMFDFCLAGGERVLLADGTLRRMDEIEVGDRVWSHDGERIVPDRVTRAWSTGIREVHAVRLKGGRVIRATDNHRLYTRHGWREVGEIRAGDEIMVPRCMPEPEEPGELSRDDAFLMALWLAEGTKTRVGFTVTNQNEAVRARVREIAAARGWDVYEGDRGSMALTQKWAQGPHTPAGFLRKYGLRGMTTATIHAPKALMRARAEVVAEFVRTYAACDGYVGPREVTFASASERMIRDLQALTARLGMPGTVRSVQPRYPGSLRSWVLAIAEKGARENVASMGVYGKLEGSGSWDAPVEHGWAEVVEIAHDGLEETFDIETADHHAFFLEGGLSHNSDARIKSAIEASPYLMGRIPSGYTRNKGLKQIGTGFMYSRGSESADDLQSIDADAMCMDEYDDIRPERIPDAERRISGSRYGLIRRVGVPDIPNHGIDKLYKASDMRRWMIKCDRCGEWQHLEFPANVDKENATLVCQHCRKQGVDALKGEWVPEYPERTVRGYHVPRLAVAHTNIRKIIEASKQTSPSQKKMHVTKDLGLPFADEEGQLAYERIMAARREHILPSYVNELGRELGEFRTMGVDVASTRPFSVRASAWTGETKQAIHIGLCDSIDEVAELMRALDINMCCIDHMPEHRTAERLAGKFPGRVYLAKYATQNNIIEVRPDEGVVSVRRTEAIDATFDMIRQQRNYLPWEVEGIEGYVEELQAPIRKVDRNAEGKTKVYYESMSPDDYAHAEVYDMLAGDVWWWVQSVNAAEEGEVMPMEQMYDFDRIDLQADEYDPGQPGTDEYDPGNFD